MSDSLYDVIFDYVVENQHAAMDVTVTKYTDGLRDAVIEWAKSEDATHRTSTCGDMLLFKLDARTDPCMLR